MTVQFETIRRNAVAHEAITTIKGMIVRGDLRAGQRLPAERELAAQLGVSRPSLREAIRALIALNILESRHGEGTFVSSLDPELLAEPIDFVLQVDDGGIAALFEARHVLEAGIAALAAERASDLELAELEGLRQAWARQGRRPRGLYRARRRVSRPHPSRRAQPGACEHARQHQHPLARDASPYGTVAGGALARARRPRSMAKTLKARDPEAARRAMSAHLDHVRRALS